MSSNFDTTRTSPRVKTYIATIANGSSHSPVVSLEGRRLIGIGMPAAWTTAVLTLQSSPDQTTANALNVYDAAGQEFTIQAAASRYIALDPGFTAGLQELIVRSGTNGSPVTQGGDRDLTLYAERGDQ